MAAGDVREVEFRGARFRFRETELHASWWTFYDEQEVRDRHWHVQPGDVVFDVGAAFGSYALPALALDARVVAFSPADFDTGLLAENLFLNPGFVDRCEVVREGVHERDGWFDPDHSVFSDERGEGPQWIRVRSLDSFVDQHAGEVDRLDWIKMDVEGAELGALRGAERTIRRFRPKMLIECHDFHVPGMHRLVCKLVGDLDLGYGGLVVPHGAVSHAYFEAVG